MKQYNVVRGHREERQAGEFVLGNNIAGTHGKENR